MEKVDRVEHCCREFRTLDIVQQEDQECMYDRKKTCNNSCSDMQSHVYVNWFIKDTCHMHTRTLKYLFTVGRHVYIDYKSGSKYRIDQFASYYIETDFTLKQWTLKSKGIRLKANMKRNKLHNGNYYNTPLTLHMSKLNN